MLDEYRDMDVEELADEIFDTVYDNFEYAVNLSSGHAKDLHAGKTDIELIERMVKENKPNVSTFYNEQVMKDAITDAISAKSMEIANWLQKEAYLFGDNKEKYKSFEIKFDKITLDGEPLGYGMTTDKEHLGEKVAVQGMESPAFTVVLERDMGKDSASPLGFYLKTAYVDITAKEAERMEDKSYSRKDISDLRESKLTPYEKAALSSRHVTRADVRPGKDPFTGEPQVTAAWKEKDGSLTRAFISEDRISVKIYPVHGRAKELPLDSINTSRLSVIRYMTNSLRVAGLKNAYLSSRLNTMDEILNRNKQNTNSLSKVSEKSSTH